MQQDFPELAGGAWGGAPPPHPTIFFETLPNQNPPWGTPLLKNEAPPSEKQPSPPPPPPSLPIEM